MCGRGRQTAATVQAVAEALTIPTIFRPANQVPQGPSDDVEDEYSPFNNGAPGRMAPIVLEGPSEEPAVITTARWGLVPSFQSSNSPPDFWRMFNAREDNLGNVHGRLLSTRRCIVPLEGFYEWENRVELGRKRKVPYYVSAKDGKMLHMAGLWDTWKNGAGKTIRTFTIITVSPSEDLKWLHDRMPAILQGEEECRMWLSESMAFASVKHLIRPYKVGGLQWWPVTEAIGKLGYQAADCAQPVELVKGTKSITNFFTKKGKDQSVAENKDALVIGEKDLANKCNEGGAIGNQSAKLKNEDALCLASDNQEGTNKRVKVMDYFQKSGASSES